MPKGWSPSKGRATSKMLETKRSRVQRGRSTFRNRQIVATIWQYTPSVAGDLLSKDLRRVSRR